MDLPTITKKKTYSNTVYYYTQLGDEGLTVAHTQLPWNTSPETARSNNEKQLPWGGKIEKDISEILLFFTICLSINSLFKSDSKPSYLRRIHSVWPWRRWLFQAACASQGYSAHTDNLHQPVTSDTVTQRCPR